jgi:hypothetical protein
LYIPWYEKALFNQESFIFKKFSLI